MYFVLCPMVYHDNCIVVPDSAYMYLGVYTDPRSIQVCVLFKTAFGIEGKVRWLVRLYQYNGLGWATYLPSVSLTEVLLSMLLNPKHAVYTCNRQGQTRLLKSRSLVFFFMIMIITLHYQKLTCIWMILWYHPDVFVSDIFVISSGRLPPDVHGIQFPPALPG